MTRRSWLVVGLSSALGLALSTQARAQDVAPPIAVEPQRVEVSTPEAPAQMRAEDAQRLREGLGLPPVPPAPRATQARQPQSVARPVGGTSRTILVESPSVVNRSPQFQFRDVTTRGATAPSLSLAERRATVETYRQSLKRGSTR